MDWKERKELNEEYTDYLLQFEDAFNDLLDALEQMKKKNDWLIGVNLEHSSYLKTEQDKTYEMNDALIRRIEEAIYGNNNN